MKEIRKVAMTGASGPIGLAVLKKLLEEDVKVLIFQRKNTYNGQFLPKHKNLKTVYCSLDELKTYEIEEADYDAFLHFGWANTAREKRNSIEWQLKNVSYTCESVKLAKKLGCHTFIGAGSQAEYGRSDTALAENSPCYPETAYGIMKLCACQASALLCEEMKMRHIWPRILSAYGKGDAESSVLSATALKCCNGEMLEFTPGEQLWDFVHLSDVAEAFWAIIRKGRDGARYPIGSGKAVSLRCALELLGKEMGVADKMCFGAIPYGAKQIMHLEADISSLEKDTGWCPKVELTVGISEIASYYREKSNLV